MVWRARVYLEWQKKFLVPDHRRDPEMLSIQREFSWTGVTMDGDITLGACKPQRPRFFESVGAVRYLTFGDYVAFTGLATVAKSV